MSRNEQRRVADALAPQRCSGGRWNGKSNRRETMNTKLCEKCGKGEAVVNLSTDEEAEKHRRGGGRLS